MNVYIKDMKCHPPNHPTKQGNSEMTPKTPKPPEQWTQGDVDDQMKNLGFKRRSRSFRDYSNAKQQIILVPFGWIKEAGVYDRLIGYICDYLGV